MISNLDRHTLSFWEFTMPRLLIALCLICLAAFATTSLWADDAAPNTNSLERVRQLVRDAETKFAPDKRVEVFEIEVKQIGDAVQLSGATTSPAARDSLAETLADIVPDAVDKVALLPAADLGERTYGVVNISVANLRYKPAYSAEMGLQLLLGTPVRVLQYDRWYRVQSPNRYICYLTGSSIVRMTRDEFNDWTSAPKLVFVDHYGFSYERPDTAAQTVSDLVSGCMLKLESQDETFYAVSYPDGRKAFVLKSQAKPFEQWEAGIELTADSVLRKAKSLMGLPYLWAGNSAKAVDCSGFTSLTFFLHGVIIPRDASQQVRVGQPVELTPDFKNLQPADLLFFGKLDENGNIRSIRHVAFYLGDGEFLHSATRVKINSLLPDRPDYDRGNAEELVRVRRFLGQVGTPGIERIRDNPLYRKQQP